MTACTEWREALIEHALGRPPEAALEAYLAACPACTEILGAWREKAGQLDAVIQQLTAAEPRALGPERVLANLDPGPSGRLYWRLAAAALVLIACFIAAIYRRSRSEQDVPPATIALAAWRSPTQSLLRSSVDPLLKEVPRLGKSFIETKSIGDKNAQ